MLDDFGMIWADFVGEYTLKKRIESCFWIILGLLLVNICEYTVNSTIE